MHSIIIMATLINNHPYIHVSINKSSANWHATATYGALTSTTNPSAATSVQTDLTNSWDSISSVTIRPYITMQQARGSSV